MTFSRGWSEEQTKLATNPARDPFQGSFFFYVYNWVKTNFTEGEDAIKCSIFKFDIIKEP